MDITITRRVAVPDKLKVERFRKAPELGPSLLFFSGGSALASLSRRLIYFTHNSIHLITPFDSGGSSASLRSAFHMPSVGDVRNRLMALSDQSVLGNPDVFKLFAHRLKRNDSNLAKLEFNAMLKGDDPLVAIIIDPLRKIIRNHLRFFFEAAPDNFDYSGASIGNLILVGGYLNSEKHLDPVAFLFSRLVEVRGTVRPVVNKWANLMAECEDGTRIIGQKEITERHTCANLSPIVRLSLVNSKSHPEPVSASIRKKISDLIRRADLIIYPMGSFFTSVVANLLPDGIGSAVAVNGGSKVFVPNTSHDLETTGLSLNRQVEILIEHLKRTAPVDTYVRELLDFVVLDTRHARYQGPYDLASFRERGGQVIDTPLISPKSEPLIDEGLLIPVLLSLV